MQHLLPTASMTGPKSATSASTTPNRPVTLPRVSSDTKIWMATELGRPCRHTAQYGFPPACQLVGPLIATATGYGSRPGDGPGSITRLGDLLHFTMAAGFPSVVTGAGLRVQLSVSVGVRRSEEHTSE